jgi:sigma-E factor negative regulatory protein RseC
MKHSESIGSINHEGFVHKVNSKSVTVIISAATACSGCHAENSCTLSGKEEKSIEVPGIYNVKPGDTVTILMEQSMGYAAIFLGYLIPLFCVMILLIFLVSIKVPELLAGLISLAILIPYYITLFLFRKQINRKFIFTLKH